MMVPPLLADTCIITKPAGGLSRQVIQRTNVTEDDEGKPVIDPEGETVGMVTEVRAGTAYVNPSPGITDTIRSKLGWGSADEDDYQLDSDRIDAIMDYEIRLKS